MDVDPRGLAPEEFEERQHLAAIWDKRVEISEAQRGANDLGADSDAESTEDSSTEATEASDSDEDNWLEWEDEDHDEGLDAWDQLGANFEAEIARIGGLSTAEVFFYICSLSLLFFQMLMDLHWRN